MRVRQVALRAFDAAHMMVDAEILEGAEMEPLVREWLARPEISYIQVHNAKRGCYSGRIERA
nr:DUF1203 domain-containing protein [Pelagivirga sediminicola]